MDKDSGFYGGLLRRPVVKYQTGVDGPPLKVKKLTCNTDGTWVGRRSPRSISVSLVRRSPVNRCNTESSKHRCKTDGRWAGLTVE